MSDDLAASIVKAASTMARKELASIRFAALGYCLEEKCWYVDTKTETTNWFARLAWALNFLANEGFAIDLKEVDNFARAVCCEGVGKRSLVFSKVLPSNEEA